jgi:hypothetical protein
MIDPVSAKAKAPAVERRAARRTRVLMAAELEIGGKIMSATLLNLSSRGAMVACTNPPPGDGKVVLRRGALETSGMIAWVKGNHVGVKFDEKISQLQIAAILHRAPPEGLTT